MYQAKPIIVHIEDDYGFRVVFRDILENRGLEVFEADDGDKGWDLVTNLHPSLVILDMVLHTVHGLEVLKRIRNNPKTNQTPVIILTALDAPEMVSKAKALGANEYIMKSSMPTSEVLNIILRYANPVKPNA